MNYEKLYHNLVESIDLDKCCIKKMKVINKVKLRANLPPRNLAERIIARDRFLISSV